ncbi:MAG TPA: AI-2E family transporter [Egibacteraceae bacterium]|nr:AI-2E family transporter [Egibacteraceae bacterium]
MATDDRDATKPPLLLRAGRVAWATLGLALLVVAAALVVDQLRLVVVPLILALFPAALLAPVAEFLKSKRVPPALASMLTIAAAFGVLFGLGRLVVPAIADELPGIVESVQQALDQLQTFLSGMPLIDDLDVFDQPLDQLTEQLGGAGNVATQTLSAVVTVVETLVATLFGLVALFFYLKDGRRIAQALVGLVPARLRDDIAEVGERIWRTIGGYFRGQLFVALVDAVGIGIGLLVLGVPLAFPLAVLVFIGGLFPIVGAFLSGTIAVLVALADQGVVVALLVLGIVIAVQQLESNVLEPVVLSRAIHLHPLMVLVAITAGAITLGILGAFLAVPVAASGARVVEYVRGEPPPSARTA